MKLASLRSTPLLSSPLLFLAIVMTGVAAVTWTLARFSPPPAVQHSLSFRQLLYGCTAGLIVSMSVIAVAAVSDEAFVWGLRKLPAALPLIGAVERMTDMDGDGYGLFGTPPDPAPFDAAIHPYALEIPGNGIDEDVEMEVAIADVADERREQRRGLQVPARLEDAVREPGDRHADVGDPGLAAGPQRAGRGQGIVPCRP